jgi:hypothetical protein
MRVQFQNIFRASRAIGLDRYALLVEMAKRGIRLYEIDGRQMLRGRDVERLRTELGCGRDRSGRAA